MSFRLTGPPRARVVEREFDVIVVGAGPAGLSAALYSSRYGLRTLIISKTVGGKVNFAPLVDDYLGLPETPGSTLVEKYVKHVSKYNVPIIIDEVVNVFNRSGRWFVEAKSNGEFQTYVVILCLGTVNRKLNVPGEDEMLGKGVSYCATCDGPLFKDKTVAVVGGGNSAIVSALYLSNLASQVYLIHRRGSFRAFKTYIDRVTVNPKVKVLYNTVVTEIKGTDRVEAIKVKNTATGEENEINVNGVFIEIGSEPPKEFFQRIGVEVDENGYAKVKPDMSTNLPGVFAAGDCAGGPCKYRFEQISTAIAEGAVAADAAFKYVQSVKTT